MPVVLATAPDSPLFRVGRAPHALAWPDWRFVGGGRFDDPNGEFRVLYLAEQRVTCFVELLAGFRLDVELLASLAVITGPPEPPPTPLVPVDWYTRRLVGRLVLTAGQRWLDLRAPETLQVLRARLSPILVRLGVPDLDVSAA